MFLLAVPEDNESDRPGASKTKYGIKFNTSSMITMY